MLGCFIDASSSRLIDELLQGQAQHLEDRRRMDGVLLGLCHSETWAPVLQGTTAEFDNEQLVIYRQNGILR